jgi:hypothetical protein
MNLLSNLWKRLGAIKVRIIISAPKRTFAQTEAQSTVLANTGTEATIALPMGLSESERIEDPRQAFLINRRPPLLRVPQDVPRKIIPSHFNLVVGHTLNNSGTRKYPDARKPSLVLVVGNHPQPRKGEENSDALENNL